MDREKIKEGGVRKLIRQMERKRDDVKNTGHGSSSRDGEERTGEKATVMVSLAKMDLRTSPGIRAGSEGRQPRTVSVGDKEVTDQYRKRELFRSRAATRGCYSLDTELPRGPKMAEYVEDRQRTKSGSGDGDSNVAAPMTRIAVVEEPADAVETSVAERGRASRPRRPDLLPLGQRSGLLEIAKRNDEVGVPSESASGSNQDQESGVSNGKVTLPSRYRRRLVSRTKTFWKEYYMSDSLQDPAPVNHALPPPTDDHEDCQNDERTREDDVKIALDWIQQEMRSFKEQNRSLFRQLLGLRATAHQLKGMTDCQSYDLDDDNDSGEGSPDWSLPFQSSRHSTDASAIEADGDLDYSSTTASFRSFAEVLRFTRWSDDVISSSHTQSVVDHSSRRREFFV